MKIKNIKINPKMAATMIGIQYSICISGNEFTKIIQDPANQPLENYLIAGTTALLAFKLIDNFLNMDITIKEDIKSDGNEKIK